MAINTTSPTTFTAAVLIGEVQPVSGGSSDGVPSLSTTVVGGVTVPVSAAFEVQSTSGALLVPRMTGVQKNALTAVVNGMMVYDTTATEFSFYETGSWVNLGGSATGDVSGPGVSVDNAIATWNGTGGISLNNSVATISAPGALAGVISIAVSGTGAVAGQISLANAANTFSTTLKAANNAADLTLTLPLVDATSTGQPLISNAAGTLSFSPSLELISVGSQVNSLTVTGSATTAPVQISATGTDGNISIQLVPKGTGSVENAVGAVATPSYSFVGRLDTGMWSSAAATIDFSTTGGRQFQITNTAASVDWIGISGSSTGIPTLTALGADANISINLVTKGTGTVDLSGNATVPGTLKLFNTANSQSITLKAGALVSSPTFVLPLVDATTAGSPLVSDAAGNLSFQNTSSQIQYAKVNLSSANILGMNAAAVQILPAAPAGTGYAIQSFALEIIGGSAQYTAGDNVFLVYGTAVGNEATSEISSTVVTAASTGNNLFSTATGHGVTASIPVVAVKALPISITNKITPFLTGNGTGVVHVYYTTIALT